MTPTIDLGTLLGVLGGFSITSMSAIIYIVKMEGRVSQLAVKIDDAQDELKSHKIECINRNAAVFRKMDEFHGKLSEVQQTLARMEGMLQAKDHTRDST